MLCATLLHKAEKALSKSIFILCFSLLSSCTRDSQVLNLAQKFFNAYDHGDYKSAYAMLSTADKRSMSADSFCVMSSNMNDQIVRLDSSHAVSTFIERTSDGTSWVRQVWRVPDYARISESKPQDVKFSTFFTMLDSERAVPVRLDSSRTICLVEEDGHLYIYLGLDRLRKFEDSYRTLIGSYSFFVVVVAKSITFYRAGHGKYSAEASVEITNYSPFLVSGFACSISIDGHLYDSDCDAFEMTTVPSRSSVDATVRLPGASVLLTRYVHGGMSSARIKGDRITIIPTGVYFDKAVCTFMRKISMKRSGFSGFTYLAPGYSKLLLDF